MARSWERISDYLWEKKLDIETSVPSPESPHPDSERYEPTCYAGIRKIVDFLRPRSHEVFVDVGSGKGRVVCFAARRKIARVVGIEVDSELSRLCRENAARLRRRRSPLIVRNAPAQHIDYPEGHVFYLFNPFGARTLGQVLERIRESLEQNPRPIRLAYVNPVHESVFRSTSWLQQTAHWPEKRTLLLEIPEVSFWQLRL